MFGTEELFEMQPGVETRWSSPENWEGARGAGGKAGNGRKASPWFRLNNGETVTLANVPEGTGRVRRIWITADPLDEKTLRGVVLRMYWDGSDAPAVVAPLGDFFGHGPKRMGTFDNPLFSSPEGRSFVCTVPMPFKNGMKITVENASGQDVNHFYYDVDYTLGDQFTDETLYFHAFFNRENPTKLREDYEILPHLEGRGRYLGANLGIICDTERYFQTWWGEGEVKIFLDGDTDYPTLCGTGVEDYVSTAWGQGYYYSLYHGSPVYDDEEMVIGCYRLHIPDPIFFHDEVKVAIQQIGGFDTDDELNKAKFYHRQATTGEAYPWARGGDIDILNIDASVKLPVLFEREDDWSSCAYFYLDSPTSSLEALPVEKWLE